jgi:aryl-alcohol dehydrogenase-like predicted oxidoreductase
MGSERNSKIWLGANIFGYSCDERCAGEIMENASSMGIRSIDTSSSYSNGLSEKIIGNWINTNSDRDKWFISTKIGMLTGQSSVGLGEKCNIIKTVHQSQDNLQTDYLDVLFLHNPDLKTEPEETISAFLDLYQNKVIKAVGFSNVDKPQIMKYIDTLIENSIYEIPIYVQNEFNWSRSHPNFWLTLFKDIKKIQIFSVSYGILNQGILAQTFADYKKLQSQDEAKRANKSRKIDGFLKNKNLEECLEALDLELKTLGSNLFDFSLHFSLINSDYSIWGVRNIDQLAKLSRLGPVKLSDLDFSKLMKIVNRYRSEKSCI